MAKTKQQSKAVIITPQKKVRSQITTKLIVTNAENDTVR